MSQDRLTIEHEIVAALRRIIRAVDQHSRQLLDGFGLTGPQLLVLQETARLGGGASASSLARAVHLSRPSVAGILDRLEKRGLIGRAPDPADRRSARVSLTPAGARMLAHAPSLLQDRFRRELAAVEDWERSLILSTLQRIAFMMDAESLAAAPVLVTGPMSADDASVPANASPAAAPIESLHSTSEPGNGN
jgi:DNA-binding MarR family transcriptional regulator